MLKRLCSTWRALWRRSKWEKDLEEELRSHIEFRTEDLIASGLSGDAAERQARIELGAREFYTDQCREAHGLRVPDELRQDLTYAGRLLRRSPGFTAVAVLTLALGIGANTAFYSLVEAVLLRPLPYRNPEELVLISETVPKMGGKTEVGVAAGEYLDYREHSRSFVQTGAYEATGFNLTGEGSPARINAAAVTASVFPLLGVSPILGRSFTIEEQSGGAPVAVLSFSLWQNRYGGDRGIIGQTIRLDEKSYQVIGVMPDSFRFPFDGAPLSERAELWVPEHFAPARLQDRLREFGIGFIARVKPGLSLQKVQADVSTVAAAFMQQYGYSDTVKVVPQVHRLASYAVEKARPLILLLAAAVGCILLIACANVANLLLARGAYRGHEMALRSAIGATGNRLLRQCLVEGLVLSIAGAGAGLVSAALLIDGIRKFGPRDIPRLQDVALNPSALLFTLALSVGTMLVFGLIPSLRLSHTSPVNCLKESRSSGTVMATHRLQNFVVVTEIAATLILLLSGALLSQSFIRVLNVPLGFQPARLAIIRTLFDAARYPDAAKRAIVQKELIDRLSTIQKVRLVAAATHLPLSDTRQIGFRLEHAGPEAQHWAENSLVSPGYFSTMGIPILRGREFTDQDRRDTPLAAVISETLARRYFQRQDPVGQRFYWGRSLFTIVGIAGDVRISALDADPPPMIYHSMFQVQSGASQRTALIVRVDADAKHPEGIFSAIRQQIWSLDRDLPAYNFTTLDALISESVAQRRFTTALILSFALIALALALVGLFGVISFLAAQRKRELAIRIALGAAQAEVCWMVTRRGAVVAMAGCAIGLAFFPLCERLVRAALYQTSSYDPATLTLGPVLLLIMALIASYLPARRATKLDPIIELRE